VRAEVYDARLEAAQILERARAEAAQLTAAAQASIERERARGYAQGVAEGHARAARELLDIATARDGMLRERERELGELTLLLAAKLAGPTFERDPRALEALMTPLLERVRRARTVVLRVAPDAADYVRARIAALVESLELEAAIEVQADPAIAMGGCVVESDLGTLDARLETRVTELARALGWAPA
jgi:flagellar biosynthesis/type III secretory pathway protein FliH